MAVQLSRTIALRKKLVKIHESRRLKKAVSYLKDDIARHTKSDVNSIRFTGELNGYLMQEVAKQMSRVSVVINKDAGLVKVDLSPELKKTRIKPVQVSSSKSDKKTGAKEQDVKKTSKATVEASPKELNSEKAKKAKSDKKQDSESKTAVHAGNKDETASQTQQK